jgi:two-component system KDP operon response regulator KdpE
VVHRALADEFSRVLEAATGDEGIDLAASQRPDLIVLDLGLPDRDGREVCVELRKWSKAGILVLSARHVDTEKIELLNAGADDYLTKPFNTLELKARAVALLRRTAIRTTERGPVITCGSLTMDLVARSLTLDGRMVHVTPTEWAIVTELMSNAGRTLTHQQLFAAVWPRNSAGDAQQYLRVHIASIRRKIEDNPIQPRFILTEPGVGYRFRLCE